MAFPATHVFRLEHPALKEFIKDSFASYNKNSEPIQDKLAFFVNEQHEPCLALREKNEHTADIAFIKMPTSTPARIWVWMRHDEKSKITYAETLLLPNILHLPTPQFKIKDGRAVVEYPPDTPFLRVGTYLVPLSLVLQEEKKHTHDNDVGPSYLFYSTAVIDIIAKYSDSRHPITEVRLSDFFIDVGECLDHDREQELTLVIVPHSFNSCWRGQELLVWPDDKFRTEETKTAEIHARAKILLVFEYLGILSFKNMKLVEKLMRAIQDPKVPRSTAKQAFQAILALLIHIFDLSFLDAKTDATLVEGIIDAISSGSYHLTRKFDVFAKKSVRGIGAVLSRILGTELEIVCTIQTVTIRKEDDAIWSNAYTEPLIGFRPQRENRDILCGDAHLVPTTNLLALLTVADLDTHARIHGALVRSLHIISSAHFLWYANPCTVFVQRTTEIVKENTASGFSVSFFAPALVQRTDNEKAKSTLLLNPASDAQEEFGTQDGYHAYVANVLSALVLIRDNDERRTFFEQHLRLFREQNKANGDLVLNVTSWLEGWEKNATIKGIIDAVKSYYPAPKAHDTTNTPDDAVTLGRTSTKPAHTKSAQNQAAGRLFQQATRQSVQQDSKRREPRGRGKSTQQNTGSTETQGRGKGRGKGKGKGKGKSNN